MTNDPAGSSGGDDLLTTDEFAELAGVRPGTVKNWRAKGRGPKPIRLGHRTVRYSGEAVRSWLAARESPAG